MPSGLLRFVRCALPLVLLLGVPSRAIAQLGPANGEWPYWGGDAGSTRYSPLDQINAANVGELQVAWRWKSLPLLEGQPDPNLKATPIMIGGTLYTSAGVNQAAAIDAATGETRWVFSPDPPEISRHPTGLSGRGLAYWTDGKDARVFHNTSDGRLIAINCKTGQTYPDFGENGYVYLKKELTTQPDPKIGSSSPPIVVGDVVVAQVVPSAINPSRKEAAPGHIRGYDVRTGKRLWTFHTIPQAGEFGSETWENDSWSYTGNAGVWTLMSADIDLGYVYLPIETATHDFYGGHRLGNNLFAESLVCLNAKTGERVWHFQIVHHGLWDYDPPAAPVLCNITVDGRDIRAVALVTKQGFCFVFDRVTGEPVWPIEELPVPQSDVAGERSSPTQPFPTKPLPFERQGVTADDAIDFTSELHAEALEIMARYKTGPLYTPPVLADGKPGSYLGTLMLPGYGGGANWPGASWDPESSTLFIPSRTMMMSSSLGVPDPSRTNLDYLRMETTVPAGPRGLPLTKPPWSSITAINLSSGNHRWRVPNGAAPDSVRDHPDLKGLELDFGKMGNTGRPGVLVTKSLIFAGESGGLSGDPGGPMFRAFDKATGKIAGEFALPSKSTAPPMSYMLNGKQYIVVAVGTKQYPAELVALTLP